MKLLIGDILINSDGVGHAGLATMVRDLRRGETATGAPAGTSEIMHATTKGVGVFSWTEKAQVFRALRMNLGDALAISRVAEEIARGAKYGKSRAVFKSWSGSSSFGSSASERLTKYRDRLGMTDTPGGTPPIVKHVYCSEFVILAYQLALGEMHPLFLNLDAKHTIPGTLKSYLERDPGNWRMVGQHP